MGSGVRRRTCPVKLPTGLFSAPDLSVARRRSCRHPRQDRFDFGGRGVRAAGSASSTLYFRLLPTCPAPACTLRREPLERCDAAVSRSTHDERDHRYRNGHRRFRRDPQSCFLQALGDISHQSGTVIGDCHDAQTSDGSLQQQLCMSPPIHGVQQLLAALLLLDLDPGAEQVAGSRNAFRQGRLTPGGPGTRLHGRGKTPMH